MVISIFNDTGGYGKLGEALAAGTYMVVFKKIDSLKIQCVPVNFSTMEKIAIREYVSKVLASSETEGKNNNQIQI